MLVQWQTAKGGISLPPGCVCSQKSLPLGTRTCAHYFSDLPPRCPNSLRRSDGGALGRARDRAEAQERCCPLLPQFSATQARWHSVEKCPEKGHVAQGPGPCQACHVQETYASKTSTAALPARPAGHGLGPSLQGLPSGAETQRGTRISKFPFLGFYKIE